MKQSHSYSTYSIILATSLLLLASFSRICHCQALSPTSPPPHHRFNALSTGAHVGAAVAAAFEIAEDVSEVGHGHGMAFLCLSRLCREVNVARGAGLEEVEDRVKKSTKTNTTGQWISGLFLRILSARAVVVTLALGGLAAASVEIIHDARPGGHHGAVLLAANELMELLEQSKIPRGGMLKLISNHFMRLFLAVGATAVALAETVRSVGSGKVGAHHGVVLLGVSKSFRCLGLIQTQVKEMKED